MSAWDEKLRAEIEDLYARYATLLDEGPLEAWPALFDSLASWIGDRTDPARAVAVRRIP